MAFSRSLLPSSVSFEPIFGAVLVLSMVSCAAASDTGGPSDEGSGGGGVHTGGSGGVGASAGGGTGGASSSAGGSPSGGGQPSVPPSACSAVEIVPGGYCVVGPKILKEDGTEFVFRGVNVPGLEFCSGGCVKWSPNTVALVASWGANIVRLPLNQADWFDDTADYKQRVRDIVALANSSGMVAILDLHRIDSALDLNEQRPMPNDASITFWTELANEFKSNPEVMFELYNEPFDVDWNEWENGGTRDGYDFVGIPDLLAAVRDAGANNLVLIGGTNWSYYLDGMPDLPGSNIAFTTHLYDYSNKQPAAWEADWRFMVANAPVFITEFGPGPTGGTEVNAYAQAVVASAAAGNIHWTAWGFWHFSQNGIVDKSWDPAANSYPLTGWGNYVKDTLATP